MVEKFSSRVIRLGEYLRIAIPLEIANTVNLADQTPVNIFINDQGNIEIELQESDAPNAMCAICGIYAARKKCINCGRIVCSKCFWAFGSLCKKCARK